MTAKFWRCAVALAAAAMLFDILSATAASADAIALRGEWRTEFVIEPESSRAGCRYVDVVTRSFNLQRGPNERLQGALFLGKRREWFMAPNTDCSPAETSDGTGGASVWMWLVNEADPAPQQGIHLRGNYAGCTGLCAPGVTNEGPFDTTVESVGSALVEQKRASPPLRYSAVAEGVRDVDAAQDAFTSALRLLFAEGCNQFYARTLDPEVQSHARQDAFCEAVRPLTTLLAPVLSFDRYFAHQVAQGSLRSHGGATLLRDGDVLVELSLTLSNERGSAGLHAVMRRQPDGQWRIAAMTP